MAHRFFRLTVPLIALSALVLGGCGSPAVPEPGSQSKPGAAQSEQSKEPDSGSAPAGFESFYSQKIQWKPCEAEQIVPPMMAPPSDISGFQCATIQAPMNWDDPDSEVIELGIARHLTQGNEEAPALFFNLGGPGGDAVNSISAVVSNVLTLELVEAFQVVALDPRGVGSSTPIWCMTDEERDADIAREVDTSSLTTEERIALYTQETKDFGRQCLDRNGEIIGYVDSDSAARDFDMARALLGQEKFDYIGFSYGTVLGAIYAELFPSTVGKMVLDGAVDPALNINELSAAQLEGMEQSLYHWIEDCQSGNKCPLGSDLETGKQKMIEFFTQVEAAPLVTNDPDRPLNGSLASTAVIGSLYSVDMYPILSEAISRAFDGDGSTMLFLADYFNSRDSTGAYTDNSSDAFVSVNSLDYEPVGTPEEWEASAADLAARFPVLGSEFGFASAGMDAWPVKARIGRHRITAPGTPEILVIGTTHDPATPYFMSQNLASDLENGVLITVEGWDHTAYGRGAGDCVVSAVDQFLLEGTVPSEGLVCSE